MYTALDTIAALQCIIIIELVLQQLVVRAVYLANCNILPNVTDLVIASY